MRFLICTAMTVLLLTAGPAVAQDTLYKWVDEDGNVSYQDQPPPGQVDGVQTLDRSLRSSAATSGEALPDIDITLYAISECDACDLLRKLLEDRALPYTEKDAGQDPAVQAELRELAGVLSVPVLLIGDEVLTGYNRELILNELEEAGFPTATGTAPARAAGDESGDAQAGSGQLTREDLESMTPEQVRQAAQDAALRGEDNDLFDEDEGFLPNEDVFSDRDDAPAPDDISQWEEIPEDERIRVDE